VEIILPVIAQSDRQLLVGADFELVLYHPPNNFLDEDQVTVSGLANQRERAAGSERRESVRLIVQAASADVRYIDPEPYRMLLPGPDDDLIEGDVIFRLETVGQGRRRR
jgi:hypothetical protein